MQLNDDRDLETFIGLKREKAEAQLEIYWH